MLIKHLIEDVKKICLLSKEMSIEGRNTRQILNHRAYWSSPRSSYHKADNCGNTLLFSTARNGHDAIARMLIQARTKENDEVDIGWTPLFLAAGYGHNAVVRVS